VAIADGADCLADMAALREQAELFGPVASIATAWRAVEATTTFELRATPEAIVAARAVVCVSVPPPGDSLVLDFDATLVNSYSEKEDATPTYKKGFGFFPLGVEGVDFCSRVFGDTTIYWRNPITEVTTDPIPVRLSRSSTR
jgi:Transposase DDE domain group 1